MTKRLAERLRQHGQSAEVHLYEGQDHIPSSAGENEHHELLISFFERHLAN
jgi:acetyl esterase/lipase